MSTPMFLLIDLISSVLIAVNPIANAFSFPYACTATGVDFAMLCSVGGRYPVADVIPGLDRFTPVNFHFEGSGRRERAVPHDVCASEDKLDRASIDTDPREHSRVFSSRGSR